jgi:hypothetical protein
MTINMTGKVTDTPLKANEPTPCPIKIRSTILYNALINTPINAGMKNLSISRGIGSEARSFVRWFIRNVQIMKHKDITLDREKVLRQN